MYGYIYVADRYEGLILVGAATAIDGNPLNNFLKREVTFNPDGILNGADAHHHRRHLRLHLLRRRAGGGVAGRPEEAEGHRRARRAVPEASARGAAQFRYAYVCDEEGIKVLDITDLAQPEAGEPAASCRTPTTSTWPAPMPTSRPASRAW